MDDESVEDIARDLQRATQWVVVRYMLGDDLRRYFSAEQRGLARQTVRAREGARAFDVLPQLERRCIVGYELIDTVKGDQQVTQRIFYDYRQARMERAQGLLPYEHILAQALRIVK